MRSTSTVRSLVRELVLWLSRRNCLSSQLLRSRENPPSPTTCPSRKRRTTCRALRSSRAQAGSFAALVLKVAVFVLQNN
eukprot:2235593-Amphidinium_carterae.1